MLVTCCLVIGNAGGDEGGGGGLADAADVNPVYEAANCFIRAGSTIEGSSENDDVAAGVGGLRVRHRETEREREEVVQPALRRGNVCCVTVQGGARRRWV